MKTKHKLELFRKLSIAMPSPWTTITIQNKAENVLPANKNICILQCCWKWLKTLQFIYSMLKNRSHHFACKHDDFISKYLIHEDKHFRIFRCWPFFFSLKLWKRERKENKKYILCWEEFDLEKFPKIYVKKSIYFILFHFCTVRNIDFEINNQWINNDNNWKEINFV